MSTQLTNQEAFDIGINGVRAQGYRRSVNELGTCLYRGLNKDKCIAGHCIPDAEYQPKLERHRITAIRLDVPSLHRVSGGLLEDMQRAHDDRLKYGPTAFEVRMAEIAPHYGLIYNPPEMVDGDIVTPWFDGSVMPARQGLYQRDYKLDGLPVPGIGRFIGGRWITPEGNESIDQFLPWRGIYSNEDQK
jgi:hypothetical protein